MTTKRAIAGLVLPFSIATQALAEPVVHYEYPPVIRQEVARTGLGVSVKDIDCGKAVILSSQPKVLWASCAFMKVVDHNGQDMCPFQDSSLAGQSEAEQKKMLSSVLQTYLRHFAGTHHVCKKQAGDFAMKRGMSEKWVSNEYGEDWSKDGTCPLVDIRDMCKREMGLE